MMDFKFCWTDIVVALLNLYNEGILVSDSALYYYYLLFAIY